MRRRAGTSLHGVRSAREMRRSQSLVIPGSEFLQFMRLEDEDDEEILNITIPSGPDAGSYRVFVFGVDNPDDPDVYVP